MTSMAEQNQCVVERLKEAYRACLTPGPRYLAKMEILDIGVRITVLCTASDSRKSSSTICAWEKITHGRTNMLLGTLDMAVKALDR